jgi:hypothetical protein
LALLTAKVHEKKDIEEEILENLENSGKRINLDIEEVFDLNKIFL